jgi:hypothetical protein
MQISLEGTREGVIKKVQAIKATEVDDAKQVAAVKLFLAAEVASLPAALNGVMVSCQITHTDNSRTIQSTIIGKEFHL